MLKNTYTSYIQIRRYIKLRIEFHPEIWNGKLDCTKWTLQLSLWNYLVTIIDSRVVASKIEMSFRELTEGCSPLTFCSCLFCGPVVGVRGSAFPALLAPLPGAAVAPAAPLAGPPLPPAGDLLEGLPVVLERKRCEIRHIVHGCIQSRCNNNCFLFFLPLLTFKQIGIIVESSGQRRGVKVKLDNVYLCY